MLNDKLEKLEKILKDMGRFIIAYSGGVDSTFLLAVSRKVIGKENLLAVTAQTEVESKEDIEDAKKICKLLDVSHEVINYSLLENINFSSNPFNRCYFCKKILIKKLKEIAEERNFNWIADGTNAEDEEDIRYGKIALAEEGVRSPLKEAGLRKEEIRYISKEMGIPIWNKASNACLASRIPIDVPITTASLKRIEEGEKLLKKFGFNVVRLRDHFPIARIELEEIEKIFQKEIREEIIKGLKELGYKFITIDLEGYRFACFHR
ncbi:MAG: ATP-dependent sacrificial sulfur transferase LarE [Thermoplasmatales archaeon]|nr:ATP-dependent sacrificial sulfur transferase LarE [Thermoplasmatales archaeon]